MITIRKERHRRRRGARGAARPCLRRRPLHRRRPSGCAKAACRRTASPSSPSRPRPRRRHRAAVERLGRARRGRRCCSARSPSHPDCRGRGIGARADAARAARAAKRSATAPCCWSAMRPTTSRFGFSAEKTGGLWLPGPLRRRPASWRSSLQPGALDGRARPGQRHRPARRRSPTSPRWSRAVHRAAQPDTRAACGVTPRLLRCGVTDMNCIDPHEPTMTNWPARAVRRPDRHDRLRLHRPRHPAADRAPHRLRPLEIRGHRPGRHRPRAARRARLRFEKIAMTQRQLPGGADPAAHRRRPAAA